MYPCHFSFTGLQLKTLSDSLSLASYFLMQTYGTFGKIGTVYICFGILNVNYINEPQDWVKEYDQCFFLRQV